MKEMKMTRKNVLNNFGPSNDGEGNEAERLRCLRGESFETKEQRKARKKQLKETRKMQAKESREREQQKLKNYLKTAVKGKAKLGSFVGFDYAGPERNIAGAGDADESTAKLNL